MELEFDLSKIFGGNHILRLDQSALKRLNPRRYWAVKSCIDGIGALSTKAQGLKRVLTSYEKVLDSDDNQVVYIIWEKHLTNKHWSCVIGLLKIGYKTLYLLDEGLKTYTTAPLCVLDFYIHNNYQRKGFGHQIFDFMLQSEKCSPEKIAIDKPSEQLLIFMSNCYNLDKPIWQMNNFVVFPSFFIDLPSELEATNEFNDENAENEKLNRTVSLKQTIEETTVEKLIHGNLEALPQIVASPNTPKGLKYARDLGHQSIW